MPRALPDQAATVVAAAEKRRGGTPPMAAAASRKAAKRSRAKSAMALPLLAFDESSVDASPEAASSRLSRPAVS
eukprot:1522237-Pleurochrysis_carterae.AAC.1